jgi:hypothetical protein
MYIEPRQNVLNTLLSTYAALGNEFFNNIQLVPTPTDNSVYNVYILSPLGYITSTDVARPILLTILLHGKNTNPGDQSNFD